MPELLTNVDNGLRLACLYSCCCKAELNPALEAVEEAIMRNFLGNADCLEEDSLHARNVIRNSHSAVFYRLIAVSQGRDDFFEEGIVSAHWLGNELLKPINKEDIEKVMGSMVIGTAYDRFIVDFMKIKDLVGGKAHHNFYVFQTIVPFWLKKIREDKEIPPEIISKTNACLVRPAIAVGIRQSGISVRTLALEQEKQYLVIHKGIEEEVSQGFVPEILQGDFLSLHLGMARQKLERREMCFLENITSEALNFAKNSKKGSI